MKRALGLLVGTAFLATPLTGQVELGVDMVLQVTNFSSSADFIDLDNVTTFNLPASQVRLGVFVTPQVSIEPRLGVTYGASGGESVSGTQAQVSAYYHFPEMRGQRAAFLRFGVGASILSSSNVSDTQMLIDAGVGLKFPVRDQLLLRVEAFGGRSFESDASRAATRLGTAFGFSWFSQN